MGSDPVEGVGDAAWFEFYDDSITVDPSSDADRAFLAGLRARAVSQGWPVQGWDTWAYHDLDDGRHLLRVGVWVANWLTFGVEFDGSGIRGDAVHHEIPFDIERPTEAAMEHTGSVEFLVQRAAEWFEWLLSWPIERGEWPTDGVLYPTWLAANAKRQETAHQESRPMPRPEWFTRMRGVQERGRMRWWDFLRRREN